MLSRKVSGKLASLLYKSTRSISEITNEIEFTPKFFSALNEKLMGKSSNTFLRLEIFGGEGCEGYSYKFKFDEQLDEANDLVKTLTVFEGEEEKRRVGFAVNNEDIRLLRGATMDYAEQMMREIFYVKQNPNAQISCSCKVSFSPKDHLL